MNIALEVTKFEITKNQLCTFKSGVVKPLGGAVAVVRVAGSECGGGEGSTGVDRHGARTHRTDCGVAP